MRGYNYIWLMLLPMVAVGCSKGDSATTPQVAVTDSEIEMISAPTSEFDGTKGSVVDTFSDIESLGVYAFSNDDIYINNRQPVLDDDGYWTFNPAINWPESDGVGFVAYAPYITDGSISANSAGFKISSVVGENSLDITYEMPTDVSKHKDLLVACEMGVEGEVVELEFKHALAAISFKIDSQQEAGIISEGFSMTGVYDNATLQATSDGFSWVDVSQIATINERVYYTEFVSAPASVAAALVSSDQYIMVIPQTIPNSMSLSTTLVDGEVVTTSVSGSWAAGKVYTYLLYVEGEDISGGDTGAGDGEDDGDNENDSSKASISIVGVEVSSWNEAILGEDADLGSYNPTTGTTLGGDVDEWSNNSTSNLTSN